MEEDVGFTRCFQIVPGNGLSECTMLLAFRWISVGAGQNYMKLLGPEAMKKLLGLTRWRKNKKDTLQRLDDLCSHNFLLKVNHGEPAGCNAMSWLYHRITFWSRFCSDQEVLIVTIHLLVLSRAWMGMGEWGNGGMGEWGNGGMGEWGNGGMGEWGNGGMGEWGNGGMGGMGLSLLIVIVDHSLIP